MTDIQKQAVKDVLHLIVDKEEPVVVGELISKLPAPYNTLASAIFSAVNPLIVTNADKAIEGIK